MGVKKTLDKTHKINYSLPMINENNITKIAEAVALANANGNKVSDKFAGLFSELQEEKLAEDLVIEHGLLEASEKEVEDEFVSLDAVEREESEDFDNDENLVDMDNVSGSLREIFGE